MRIETPEGYTVQIKDGYERTILSSNTAGDVALPAALTVGGALTVPGGPVAAYVDKSFTAAEVNALNTAATVVAAPAAGYALIFEGAVVFYDYAAAFTIGSATGLAIKYTDGSGTGVGQTAVTGFIDQASDQTRYIRPWTAASGASQITPVAAAPLVANMLSANTSSGTGSVLKLRVYYRIVPFTL